MDALFLFAGEIGRRLTAGFLLGSGRVQWPDTTCIFGLDIFIRNDSVKFISA